MKRIQHNDFKMYTPPGVGAILTNYCQQLHIYKSPEYAFFNHLFIVSHITMYSHYRKTDRDGCPLNIKMLSTILGTKDGETCAMVRNLVDLKIIHKVRNYQAGNKSTVYMVTNTSSNLEKVTALPEYSLIPTKIIKRKNAQISNPSNALKMYGKFLRKLTGLKPADWYTTMDHTGDQYLMNLNSTITSLPSFSSSSYSGSLSNIPLMIGEYTYNATPVMVTGDLTKGYCTTQKANSYTLSLEAIEKGDWFVHRPDKKSRVYTNITNLYSPFKKYLRYDDQPLVELDIRNSQPLIATILIKDYWTKKSITLPADVIQYQSDCEAGTFYDHFMNLNNVPEEKRGEFKVKMFGEVFFSKVSKKRSRLKTQFISKYPSVYQAICEIKGGYGSKTYNQFAIQLQRKEASIIFDTVNMQLLRAGIPAFNIFDSILCLREHQEKAQGLLLAAFSQFNITPTINIKS